MAWAHTAGTCLKRFGFPSKVNCTKTVRKCPTMPQNLDRAEPQKRNGQKDDATGNLVYILFPTAIKRALPYAQAVPLLRSTALQEWNGLLSVSHWGNKVLFEIAAYEGKPSNLLTPDLESVQKVDPRVLSLGGTVESSRTTKQLVWQKHAHSGFCHEVGIWTQK